MVIHLIKEQQYFQRALEEIRERVASGHEITKSRITEDLEKIENNFHEVLKSLNDRLCSSVFFLFPLS